MVELRARRLVVADGLGPRDHEGRAGAAEMGGHQLGALEGRVAGPGEAAVVHVVHVPRPESVEAPKVPVQHLDLLRDGARQLVLGEQLVDGPLEALRRGTVVREDVYDQRVVGEALPVQLVQDLAVLRVRVLQEARVDLGQPQLEGPLGLGDVPPLRHGWVQRGELGVLRDPAHGLLLSKRDVAQLLPAHVELALVLVRPLLVDVVGTVRAAGGKVDEEGPVGGERAVVADELHGLSGDVLGEVVALLRRVRGLDRICVLEQARLVLRRLAGQEAVEVAEAQTRRVPVEGP
mmetsp:Transcript_117626/g.312926  ORF Transcript_117626/g.312926 Transcript_117626/m.312926 type:complete len:291 (+) Transcript_117626:1108-1980(+)